MPSCSCKPAEESAIIAVLGTKDFPTDAVDDYTHLLGGALRERGRSFMIVRIPWEAIGRIRALWHLWRMSPDWKQRPWILLQYTALMWSRRGFPPFFLLVLCMLWLRGGRIAVVFHDPRPYPGNRWVDKVRRACQSFVMRSAYRLAERSILNIPLDGISWLPARPAKAVFIPIAPTILPTAIRNPPAGCAAEAKVIAILGVTDAGDIGTEVGDTAFVARRAAEHLPRVRLLVVGRGSERAEPIFRRALEGSRVEFQALGVLPAHEISQVLVNADVTLFVRGCVSTQRSTVTTSIAHAVPLVGYADGPLPPPLAEAGVLTVRYLDAEKLAEATVRVLTDQQLWCDLHERSRRAHERYLSWDVVAGCFLEAIGHV